MADLKTKQTKASVAGFLKNIADETRRAECRTLLELMQAATGERPSMWGPSIVGFGSYHYKYASGREGDWFRVGFSPRKQALTVYIMSGFTGHESLLKKLGKHTTGKGCLYIKHLADVDLEILARLVRASVKKPMGQVAD
jgi:hypothetical protein